MESQCTRLRVHPWCPFGVHDLSRTELSASTGLPRFNMPFELGLYLGAKEFGTRVQAGKQCLILDSERFRFRGFISDIGGQDVVAHSNEEAPAIRAVRDWLDSCRTAKSMALPSGGIIAGNYAFFRDQLPRLCKESNLLLEEVTYLDFVRLVRVWLDEERLS